MCALCDANAFGTRQTCTSALLAAADELDAALDASTQLAQQGDPFAYGFTMAVEMLRELARDHSASLDTAARDRT